MEAQAQSAGMQRPETDILEDSPKPSVFIASKNILLQCVSTLLFLPLSLTCLPLYIIGLFISLGASTYDSYHHGAGSTLKYFTDCGLD